MFVWLLGFALASGSALADAGPTASGDAAWVRAHASKLRLCFNPDFPPLEFESDSGEFVGMGADVMNGVERRLGITFPRQVEKDWSHHLEALKDGNCAIAPTIVQTEEREPYARFTTPYARVPVVIIGTPSLGNHLTLDDLKGKRVAVVHQFATESYVRKHAGGRFEIVEVPAVEEGLREVAFGRVDAHVENLAVASHYITANGITNLQVCGTTDYEFVFRIAVSRKYPALFEAIQGALDEAPPGETKKLQQRWIALRPQAGMSQDTRRWLLLAGAFSLLLIAGLALISFVLKRRLGEKMATLQEAQRELDASRKHYRELFFQAPLPLIEFTLDGRIEAYNHAATRILGYSLEDISTVEAWLEAAYPDPDYRKQVRAAFEEDVATVLRGGETDHGEYTIRCKDGTTKTCLGGLSILGNRGVVSFMDVEEQRRMRAEVEAGRARIAALLEVAPFSCTISDFDGRFLMVNRHFCETVNRPREEILGRTSEELGFALDESARDVLEAVQREGESKLRELTVKTPNGGRTLLVAARKVDWEEGEAILNVTVDITDRKEAEERLRASEERFVKVFALAPDAIAITRVRDGYLVDVNDGFEQATSWPKAEVVGRRLEEIRFWVDRSNREEMVKELESRGEVVQHDILFRRKDGKVRTGVYSARAIDLFGEPHLILVMRDVTEERAAQEQLRQSQKMEAVGQLAGGVAHDFNNMLAAIMGSADLLQYWFEEGSEELDLAKDIISASQRAADLTQKLLVFSRKRDTEMAAVDVDLPIRDALGLLERTIDPRIRLDVSLEEDVIQVQGDRSLLQSAILNLLINATHAMPEGGTLRVATRRVVLDDAACKMTGFAVRPGPHVEVEVRDSGVGIPHEHLSRIFDPFFTTKEQGKGTGLGLSAVFGTVKQHQGAITVYSEVGTGTCFRILLPISGEQPGAGAVEEDVEGGVGRILLVDDEPVLRDVATRMLTRLGYEVTTASNGNEAIETFEVHGGAFDLVILDMSMPEMNGRDCFYQLRKRRPDVRVMISSGFTRDEDLASMMSDGLLGFIQKPYRSAQLGREVRAALLPRSVASEAP